MSYMANRFLLGGDWAGGVYGNSGCPGTCVGVSTSSILACASSDCMLHTDYVNNNPAAFRDAYFDFAGIRVYQ